jgi:hypothetical protein
LDISDECTISALEPSVDGVLGSLNLAVNERAVSGEAPHPGLLSSVLSSRACVVVMQGSAICGLSNLVGAAINTDGILEKSIDLLSPRQVEVKVIIVFGGVITGVTANSSISIDGGEKKPGVCRSVSIHGEAHHGHHEGKEYEGPAAIGSGSLTPWHHTFVVEHGLASASIKGVLVDFALSPLVFHFITIFLCLRFVC